jgi:hypothetical protein
MRYTIKTLRTPEQEAAYRAMLERKKAERLAANPERIAIHRESQKHMSPEREALLRKLAVKFVTYEHIRLELNKLPGKPFTNWRQISSWAHARQISRPEEVLRFLYQVGANKRLAERNYTPWTHERIALLKTIYPSGDPEDIIVQLSALSGKPIRNWRSVQNFAQKQGFARAKPGFKRPKVVRERAPYKPKPKPEPKPVVVASPPRPERVFVPASFTVAAKLTPIGYVNGDMDEAAAKILGKMEKAKLALKQKKEPAEVARNYGLRLSEVFRLKSEVDRERKGHAHATV